MPFDPLARAGELAREIAGAAVWFEDRCSWMGARPGDDTRAPGSQRVQAALGPDLYDGTSGVAIFLAEAATALDDDHLRTTAFGALRHALTHSERVPHDGLYAGRVGIAYAAARVAARTGSEAAHEGARAILRGWRRSGGGAPGVLDGTAGTAIGLVALAEPIGEPRLLETAAELGDDLIAGAARSAAGWSWSGGGPEHHLCGYAHGAAGVGHALFELSRATGEPRFREAADRAFDYERSWFDRRGGSWPDLRGVARSAGWDLPAPARAWWCHGAPGIALSRLRARHADAGAAVALTREAATSLLTRVPDDLSLCHGAAGVADVLLYAGDTELATALGRACMEGESLPSGLPDGQTPGLFLGLSGIGVFLLRLAAPSLGTPLIVHPLDTAESPDVESKPDPRSEVSRARVSGPRA
jgi:lantibiotic modifying enzyme